jgi:hypothetical protein
VIGSKAGLLQFRVALQSWAGVVSPSLTVQPCAVSSLRGTAKQVVAVSRVSGALRQCWREWVVELGWSRARLSVDDGSGSCSCSQGHLSWIPSRALLALEVLLELVVHRPAAGTLLAVAALGRVSHFYSETFFGRAPSLGELFL